MAARAARPSEMTAFHPASESPRKRQAASVQITTRVAPSWFRKSPKSRPSNVKGRVLRVERVCGEAAAVHRVYPGRGKSLNATNNKLPAGGMCRHREPPLA